MSLHGGHGSLAPSGPAIGSADCSVSGDMDHARVAISGGQCPSRKCYHGWCHSQLGTSLLLNFLNI